MKRYPVLVACVLLLLFAVACKTTGEGGGGAESLDVSFEFAERHGCSNLSPEIRVGNVPVGTESFSVKLKDFNAPGWNHGGGTVDYDGDGVIPEGALTSGYNGPCPPSGRHTYQFTVKARDAQGNTLSVGKAKRKYP